MRADTKVAKTIQINKDNAKVSCGCSKSVIETDCKHKLKDIMQSDEMEEKMTKRKLVLVNRGNEPRMFTKNKTIMDCIIKQVKS